MKAKRYSVFIALLFGSLGSHAFAAPPKIDGIVDQPDEWFTSEEGRKTLDVILSYQKANGGWGKAYKLDVPRAGSAAGEKGDIPGDDSKVWDRTSTIDNGATHSEIRILARAFHVTKDERYSDAVLKGLKFLYDAQYANGGWPQRFPLEKNYGRHITYNDDAMISVMRVLRDIRDGKPDFAWLDDAQRQHAAEWFETHKIEGKRLERLEGPQYELGKQRNLVDDPNAKPIWARFYDLDTGKPYFCDRDGVKLDSFEKLGHERRVNYAWFNNRGNDVLERFAKWRAQQAGN